MYSKGDKDATAYDVAGRTCLVEGGWEWRGAERGEGWDRVDGRRGTSTEHYAHFSDFSGNICPFVVSAAGD